MTSPKTSAVIWARAAGRCEYASCNVSLIGDLISGNEDGKFGFIAHIVAEQPGGPRGDPVRSPLLADDPANLMLLCYKHHKLIDVDDRDAHSEQYLLDMKAAYERRIEIVTDIHEDRASHVLRYGAKIGSNESLVSFERARLAMLPDRYPADGRSIGIEIKGSVAQDGEDRFWQHEPDNLRQQFETLVRPRIAEREIAHLSVFALAPIPLLIEFGHLLCDIVPADVYQLHREPAGWKWAKTGERVQFVVEQPNRSSKVVALKMGLSATISDDRIRCALAGNVEIWSVTARDPNNDMMRHPEDLQEFRRVMRRLYNDIKSSGAETIHVFPAIPVSTAVEMGRVWMPKADLPMLVYDETRGRGFVPRLKIG
jgi:CBASS immunity sensor of nucleotide second messenger signals